MEDSTKKLFLEFKLKAPVINGRPILLKYKKFKEINNFINNEICKIKYNNYKRFISKCYPLEILIKNNIIKENEINLYKNSYNENFDKILNNFIRINRIKLENYIKLKNLN